MTQKLDAWMTIASAALIGFGLAVAAASHPALAAPVVLLGDLIFWPLDGAPDMGLPAARLLAAIAGGVMAGWGVMLLAFARGKGVRAALAQGAIAWFVVDSLGSILAGAPINVAMNLGFLGLFLMAARLARPTAARG